jgi:cellulose synthase/poly-beta-1,6-N-acetylglucosamine synthase-like glycosyltransferase
VNAAGGWTNGWAWLFWLGCAVIIYTYAGYGLLVYLWVRWRCPQRLQPPPTPQAAELPALTLIVPAYNEAAVLPAKLRNCLELDYPRERLELVIVTDGSTDGSERLLAEYAVSADVRLHVLHAAERRGKLAAVERVMLQVTTPITVFSDANALLNCAALVNLVKHYADPAVGAVAGEKRVHFGAAAGAEGVGEGIYWRYESLLKRLDAALYSVVGAAGELFSIRTELYESPPPDTLIEDFHLSLRIAMRGRRVAYAPDACAVEGHSASLREELKRKVRIAAGGLQAIARLPGLLNPLRYGVLSFQYVSHRVLRWTLAPLLLPLLLVANVMLAQADGWFYRLLLAAQIAFYAAALCGWLLEQIGVRIKLFYIPLYFCVMNYAVYAGAWRLLRGRQSAVWDKAQRI